MPVPTPRLAMVIAVGTAAQLVVAIVHPPAAPAVLVAWVLVSAGLASVDWISIPDPATIGFRRVLPSVVQLGQRAEATWIISNPHPRPASVEVADELAPSLRPTTRRATVVLPTRGSATVEVGFQPARRGRFVPSEVVVRTRGRWGLVAKQDSRTVRSVLRVHPRFPSRKEAEIRVNQARLLHSGIRTARIRGAGTDFDQLREYTVDDETGRIDWAATARSGHPIVKTFRAERNQTVVNLLDSGRVMAGRVDDVPRLEHAMDAVMALTAVATGLGDSCGLSVFDRTVHTLVGAAGGRSQLSRVTEAIYAVEPALVESDYAGAFASTLAHFRRRTMLVVHTDLNGTVVAEALLPAMPMILRHHVVVVCAVRDPDVINWSTHGPRNGDDARRRAAAVAALGDRDHAAARLAAAGATVIDEPAGRLAARLADTYLQIKATGRL